MESNDNGRKILQQIGVSGFMQGKPEEYLALSKWIGI
jgi:hypothetical protein